MTQWNPQGKLAVVTGASSGIGRSLCLLLIEQGCQVIAVARRSERLEELAASAATAEDGGALSPLVGDVTDAACRDAITAKIHAFGGKLDLLVNNAGIGGIGPFEAADPQRLRQIMEVNFFAPVELTRVLLPALKSSPDAVICNIGSVLGHRAVAEKSEYSASKFALHGWSDALRAELAGSSVAVTLVSPSTTRSEFFDALVGTAEGTSSKSLGSWSAERVARATLRAIKKRRGEVILSLGGKCLVYADRICPPLMNWILQRR